MGSEAKTKPKQNNNLELYAGTHVYHQLIINFRLLNVSNAWYADCNGLYSLTNLTAVWDKKRVVYQRVQGGINPGDMRSVHAHVHRTKMMFNELVKG